MRRELRRVPLDFRYPWNKPWYGYLVGIVETCIENGGETSACEQCRAAAKIKGVPLYGYGCPEWDSYLKEPMVKLRELLAPPTGEGYQLWETTTEGSPISPVFQTLDDLCAWCEDNATTVYSHNKVSKEKWKALLTDNSGKVFYDDNGIVII